MPTTVIRTSGHRIKNTHIHMNCVSGLSNICTQAGPAHAAGGDGVDRWQHSSHLLHALQVASIAL